MAQSPQGKLMTPLLCKLRYVLYMPVYLLSFLPEGVKASLVRFALQFLNTLQPFILQLQEMLKVVERDSTTIKENLKKLIFYYGRGDSWCPQHYYDEIKLDFPDGDIRLCEKGLRHAFVLDASKEMAAMITDCTSYCKEDEILMLEYFGTAVLPHSDHASQRSPQLSPERVCITDNSVGWYLRGFRLNLKQMLRPGPKPTEVNVYVKTSFIRLRIRC
uniref:Lipid droplet-associated serine hydrolase n=1 Tax=Calidris pygmaea TaxID=425635 RepID=A0A8C3KGG6_9CHAR